ncbi:hypothetical protein SCHPADRAFT_528042 [Schizopora paradoxa]|uniref:Uncharacterized protein n=1 Tax=Schizopora paradoxa TaxID=27342 RepID=A0A0H2RLB3_9AGAM|nr:hypothetical protein SCHPADRAFT_528042 [Schizopora paradoxa]
MSTFRLDDFAARRRSSRHALLSSLGYISGARRCNSVPPLCLYVGLARRLLAARRGHQLQATLFSCATKAMVEMTIRARVVLACHRTKKNLRHSRNVITLSLILGWGFQRERKERSNAHKQLPCLSSRLRRSLGRLILHDVHVTAYIQMYYSLTPEAPSRKARTSSSLAKRSVYTCDNPYASSFLPVLSFLSPQALSSLFSLFSRSDSEN